MKRGCLVCLLLNAVLLCNGQSLITQRDKDILLKLDMEMAPLSKAIVMEINPLLKYQADSSFTRKLVKALQIPYSFYYNFPNTKHFSCQYAPDSSFRMITWHIENKIFPTRQKGVIQMNTQDGGLKIFPLFDVSNFTTRPEDSVRTNKNWIGAVYYKIILTQDGDKKIYTLLGFDDNDLFTNKKWMEVLRFDATGNPIFGGDYFAYKPDELKPKLPIKRFFIEYKKQATAKFNYDENYQVVLFDHLISETNEPHIKQTLVPDGDYEAFKWSGGKWVHIEKFFNDVILMTNPDMLLGKPPLPKEILDSKGEKNEKILEEVSKKNGMPTP